MTVAELIKALETIEDKTLPVVTYDNEYGSHDIVQFIVRVAEKDVYETLTGWRGECVCIAETCCDGTEIP